LDALTVKTLKYRPLQTNANSKSGTKDAIQIWQPNMNGNNLNN